MNYTSLAHSMKVPSEELTISQRLCHRGLMAWTRLSYQPLHREIGGLLDRQRQDDKRIGVTIPPVVLMRAEKMIK
jgi:hypothetical protein